MDHESDKTDNPACTKSVRVFIIRAGIAQWLEHRTRDWKVAGSNPCWKGGGRIFFSRVDFLCWLLFRYPFRPRVTTVARKRSWSFCQKCRWQATAKHAYTLRMWLCMKWHGAWLYGVHRTSGVCLLPVLSWIRKKKKESKTPSPWRSLAVGEFEITEQLCKH